MSRLIRVYFVLTVIQLLVTMSTSQVDDNFVKDVPDEWKILFLEYQPPRIEIKLLKSHRSKDGNVLGTLEYIFSDNENEVQQNQIKADDKVVKVQMEEQKKTTEPPKFGGKSIFRLPKIHCPEGQRRDYLGRCRDIFVPPQ